MTATLADLPTPALVVERSIVEANTANMSARAADLLRDDMDAKGPVRVSEVETAQKDILDTARKLAEDGQLMLPGGDEDFV